MDNRGGYALPPQLPAWSAVPADWQSQCAIVYSRPSLIQTPLCEHPYYPNSLLQLLRTFGCYHIWSCLPRVYIIVQYEIESANGISQGWVPRCLDNRGSTVLENTWRTQQPYNILHCTCTLPDVTMPYISNASKHWKVDVLGGQNTSTGEGVNQTTKSNHQTCYFHGL